MTVKRFSDNHKNADEGTLQENYKTLDDIFLLAFTVVQMHIYLKQSSLKKRHPSL